MSESTASRLERPFSILHVCTGNIGRSPMAEYLMRAALHDRLGARADEFSVSSAGTWGCQGSGMEPFALLAVAERGLGTLQPPPTEFRARELTEDLLARADLVLTATTEHRAHAVGLVPAVVRRTFTLKEFARIAQAMMSTEGAAGVLPETRPQNLRERALANVRSASQFRGMAPRPGPGEDDVEDPIGAPQTIYWQRADEIQRACTQALDLLLDPRH